MTLEYINFMLMHSATVYAVISSEDRSRRDKQSYNYVAMHSLSA